MFPSANPSSLATRSLKGWSPTRSVAETRIAQEPFGPGPAPEPIGPEHEPPAEWIELNMGPQHPSTHGVLRVRLKLDGEIVRDADAEVGYLHTGFEKPFEGKTYTQGIPFSDRRVSRAPPYNTVVFVSSVEKLMEIEAPPRAQAIRLMMMELARIASHELWLRTAGRDLGVYSGFFYALGEPRLAAG